MLKAIELQLHYSVAAVLSGLRIENDDVHGLAASQR